MTRNDKLILIIGVLTLIIAGIGVYTWSPEVTGDRAVDIDELLDVTGVYSSQPDAVTVSICSPFYALIATPLTVHYTPDGEQVILPLYVKDLVNPSKAIIRAERMIGLSSNLIIGDSYKKSLKEISLDIAENFWKSSKGVLLIEESQSGYNLGVAATPIASYLGIPVIVTDKVDNDVREVLRRLGVTTSIVCGEIEGYGKTLRFENVDEVVNASIEIVERKFGEVGYITLSNPLDVVEANVSNSRSYFFEGTVSSTAIFPTQLVNMALCFLKGIPTVSVHEFEIPSDYKYARVKIDGRNLVDEDVEETGSRLIIQLLDPDGNILAFAFTIGGVPIRNAEGGIEVDRIHWETIIYNQPGTYKLLVSGNYLTKKTGDYEIDVTVEELESSIVPSMKALSSIAPYLTAYHRGVVLAKPEFAFVGDESIISDPSPGVVYPASNPGLIDDVNKHVFGIHEVLNKLLADLVDVDLTDEEDLKFLRSRYNDDPIYIALVGDATMIPHYYYYDTPDANTLMYGWDVASDFIYGNIDPVPRNDKVSIYANDVFTKFPHQENIVGRITGWDVQDACALVVRTIFYDNILENMPNKDWKKTATVQTGSGTDFQRLPVVDLFRRVMGAHELPVKWPTGEAHFQNVMISNVIKKGGFEVRSTENTESMRKSLSIETLNEIKKLGILNRLLFPKLRVLAVTGKASGGQNQEESNFIFTFGHGQPMGYSHGDVQTDSMGFRPVILHNLLNRWSVLIPRLLGSSLSSGLGRVGAYCVRYVENMELGPSVMMIESCYTGRIDGIYPQCCVCQAYIHAGLNALIASSRGTPGPGYLDARARPKGLGVSELIKTLLNPDLQKPHFSALHAVNIFGDLTENNVDVGTAFRNAKNKFMEDANSTFFWTPPLSLDIQTTYDLELFLKNLRLTTDEEDAKCMEKKYTCLFEYNLFGDPAFNPYEPLNEGR
jgi:hypothetical protein